VATTATIYVIDDDTGLRTAYAAALSRLGYQVETAADGLEGLKLVEKAKPSLILLDMLMPNLDGIGFLEQLHKNGANAEIKVVVASNFEQLPDIPKEGVVKYLSKLQHTPEAIAAKVDEILKAS
jgi:two-component system chemotaxis response regulator CheY